MRFGRNTHSARLAAAALAVLAAAFLAPRAVAPVHILENRKLAEAPAAPHNWAQLRAWPKAADAYVRDQFPARAPLISALNYLRYRLGVSGTDRVIVGRDGWLYYDNGTHLGPARNAPPYTDADASEWLRGLAGRTAWTRAHGAAYVLLIGPDKEVIVPEHGPSWYVGPDRNRAALVLQRLNESAAAGEIVYPAAALERDARWGLNVYNPVETHWTGLGAYDAYVELMQRLQHLGLVDGPRPLAAFREVRDDPFQPRNLSRMLGIGDVVPADYPQFVDPALTPRTTYLGDARGWSAPQVIDTGASGKPVLLMMRDSFSLALLPFLEGHFSRIVLVHHQDGAWRPELIERFKPDIVLFEVIESGLAFVMQSAPPAPAEVEARIAQALALPHHVAANAPAARERHALAPPSARAEGTPGADRLRGSQGGDAINGLAGDDTIEGLGGDDLLRGGRGNDRVFGGEGDDWIDGDLGDDSLTGGPGADTFRLDANSGHDVVLDFSAAAGDRVEIPQTGPYTVRQQGADTVVEVEGAQLVLRGVVAAALAPGWLGFR